MSSKTQVMQPLFGTTVDNDLCINSAEKSPSVTADQVNDTNMHCAIPVAESEAFCLSWHNISVQVVMDLKKKEETPAENEMTITNQQESKRLKNLKHVLKDVSGAVQTGTLLAILGASGSGKSTLLNVLSCNQLQDYILNGEVRFNGCVIGSNIRNISAYVQQEDLFLGNLTVRETLTYRALLRMDKAISTELRLERVRELIQEMGLTKCAETQVKSGKKSISGGEAKRLSLACEMLTNPPLLFCDEPTTGLDTFTAQSVISTLQSMAQHNRAILCTIHQPSSEIFAMFNKLILLAEGRVAFMGSCEEALTFFKSLNFKCPVNYNPADFFISTLAVAPGSEEACQNKINASTTRLQSCAVSLGVPATRFWSLVTIITQHFLYFIMMLFIFLIPNYLLAVYITNCRLQLICDSFKTLKEATKIMTATKMLPPAGGATQMWDAAINNSRYTASWSQQFSVLLWRSWISLTRDVLLFKMRLGQSILFAVILGLIFLQMDVNQQGVMSISGAIFVIIINTGFVNMLSVINTFPSEIHVFTREYNSGLYRTDTYFLSKNLSELPSFVVFPFIFATVVYWMIGLRKTVDAYLIASAIIILISNIAVSFGLMISAVAENTTVALALSGPILVPFMLFGGFFINNDSIPVYFIWLKYLSWYMYANELMSVNQWHGIDTIECDSNVNGTWNVKKACRFRNGDDVLSFFGFSKDNTQWNIGMMFILLVGFRIAAFVILLFRARRGRY